MVQDQEFHSSWIRKANDHDHLDVSVSRSICLIGIAIMAAKLHVCLLYVPIEKKEYELLRTMNESDEYEMSRGAF